MSTYDFDKILSDYANGRMSVEMTLGHALQHIGKLYTNNVALAASQREQSARLTDSLHQLRADVDSLIVHTGIVPRPQGKQQSPPAR